MKAYTNTLFALTVILLAVSISFSSMSAPTPKGASATTASNWSAHTMIYIKPAAAAAPMALSPTQIRAAYNLPSTGGQGTIAIIDAYDDPTVLNDLNVFSSQFNLPLPSISNFEKHMMTSGISTDSGWTIEISLDVQWAHAIAPNAKILLVEATSNSLTDLLAAVDYARSRSDVVAISMSWGGGELSVESLFDYHFTSSYGAVFFASSGDRGSGVSWPAVSTNVVGVGGTTLSFTQGGSVASETAWAGSGGGISAYEVEPSYQVSYNVPGANGKRCVPDVSYDADPVSGVAVYDSTPYSGQTGWWQVGGTSASAPQWAAIQSIGLSTSNSNFFQDASSGSYASFFRDITSGSNGGYTAKPGYDCVTGLGSPLTTNYAAAATPDFSLSSSPSTLSIQAGKAANSTITATSLKGFNGTVSLASSAPSGLNAGFDQSSLTLVPGESSSSTLSVTVLATTQAGTYTIAITGTSGSLTHSATLTVNVQTVPSAPQTLKATAGNGQVTLSWSAPSSNGGSTVTNYNIYKSQSSTTETLLKQTGNALTYTDTAVTNGQTYYYQVTAINANGESPKSNEAYATPSNTNTNTKTISVSVTTNKPTYTKGSSVAITVTAKDNSTGNALRGAYVTVKAYYPNGLLAWTSLGMTTSTGTFPVTYTTSRYSPTGTYKIVATVTYTGYQTGTAQTTFIVS